MKWRKGKADGSDAAAGGVLWARSGRFRLWRIIAMPAGSYMVPGLLRWVDTPLGTRNERRRFATVYGARMAAECEKRRCA
jgi:hypothetical protein